VQPFGLQPFLKQQQLRALAGPVDTLDDDQLAGKGVGLAKRQRRGCHADFSFSGLDSNWTERLKTFSNRSARARAAQISSSGSPAVCRVIVTGFPRVTARLWITEKWLRSSPSAIRSKALSISKVFRCPAGKAFSVARFPWRRARR